MSKRVTALYLEDNNVRLLIAEGRKVERWMSIPLEAGLVDGGVIQDEPRVAEKIRECFTAIKAIKTEVSGTRKFFKPVSDLFQGKGKLIVGLSGRDSLYRVLSLPTLPDSLLAEAINREAARVLPVSLNELYLAYKRIPGNANESRVFIAAFPKKAADTLIKTLRLAGMMPRTLDLAPLALCQSVNEPRCVIADAGYDSLNIIVMADRVPQVIRSLPLQGAEKTISDNMTTIVEEFSRTISFYNSSHQQDPINSEVPVFVSGDLANEPGSWPALVGKLNSKVAVLPDIMEHPEGFPAKDFTVNMGLAAKELTLEKQPGNYSLVNLNAMPEPFLPRPINPYRVLTPAVAVVGVAALIFMWNSLQETRHSTVLLQSQLANTQDLITSNAKSIAILTEQNRQLQAQMQPLKDSATVFTTKMSELSAARNLASNDSHSVITLNPGTVVLTSVAYTSDNKKTVTGASSTQDSVLSYAQVLRDTGGYNVVVSSITYNPTVTDAGIVIPSYEFSLQIN